MKKAQIKSVITYYYGGYSIKYKSGRLVIVTDKKPLPKTAQEFVNTSKNVSYDTFSDGRRFCTIYQ